MNAEIRSYLTTAIWSSNDESTESGGDPMDQNYDLDDIANETLAKAERDWKAFKKQAGTLLEGLDLETAAHDFWLTRNGHGAGFWDGDRYEKEVGKKLTAISQKFGGITLYIGDDGKIYGM